MVSSSQSISILAFLALWKVATSFTASPLSFSPTSLQSTGTKQSTLSVLRAAESDAVSTAPAPVLDGKRVLPLKIMKIGLKGHKVAAVYALLNSDYKKGSEGWDCAEFVGETLDLEVSLQQHAETMEASQMAHVRALSFAIPSKTAMDDWAKKWRNFATDAGGSTGLRPEDYLFDEDDEDDDEDDWDPEMLAAASAAASAAVGNTDQIVSPFDPASAKSEVENESGEEGELSLTRENVDKVLDEVRPYLIADGGNVSVEDVVADKGQVFLKLEGACGSCASSTITMSMGIERVLKENFATTFKEVVQVEDPALAGPSELTLEDIQEEFDRLYPAIIAMGGVASITSVDASLGVVNMVFRGSNKVRQGLELAILDLPFVNRVEFSMGEDDE